MKWLGRLTVVGFIFNSTMYVLSPKWRAYYQARLEVAHTFQKMLRERREPAPVLSDDATDGQHLGYELLDYWHKQGGAPITKVAILRYATIRTSLEKTE